VPSTCADATVNQKKKELAGLLYLQVSLLDAEKIARSFLSYRIQKDMSWTLYRRRMQKEDAEGDASEPLDLEDTEGDESESFN